MAKVGSYRWEGEARKRAAARKAAEAEIREAIDNLSNDREDS